MNSFLLNRATGSISPQVLERAQTARLIHALQPAPAIRFSSHVSAGTPDEAAGEVERKKDEAWAHKAGVNSITIDKFEGRYLLSGGADSAISIWDLESAQDARHATIHPLGTVSKTSSSHKFGITHLSFYPFDSLAFLSSSYDHSLKVYSSEALTASASFDLDSVVYSHALSPIASHLLVACATQHPAVRLVDLRSGASAHSLAGHGGAVLTVAWSPRDEHIVSSGGIDGTVRFWDIRRSAGSLCMLDMEDSIGITGYGNSAGSTRQRNQGKAHTGAVNGLLWTDKGDYLVTAGHDERIRVWDVSTGANTLANFGPMVKNLHLSTLLPLLAPSSLTPPGNEMLFYPNEREILMYDLFDGTLMKRLRARTASTPVSVSATAGTGQRNLKSRTTSLAWRAQSVEMFSGHADGRIRAWLARTREDAMVEEEDMEKEGGDAEEEESKKRKREALEEIYRDVTRQRVTFAGE